MKKVVLQTKNMHCASCVILIESEVEDLEGVVSASSNLKHEETEVVFDDSKVSIEQIVSAIVGAGDYKATVLSVSEV